MEQAPFAVPTSFVRVNVGEVVVKPHPVTLMAELDESHTGADAGAKV
jgi:hypothetical protein